MKQILLTCLSAFVGFAVASGCASKSSLIAGKAACCVTNQPVARASITDHSLYQLDSTWTNDSNQPIKLRSLSGRVQIVAMIFTSCQFACPLIVHDLQRLEAELPAAVRKQVGFTLVTFDIARDTPAVLHDYRQRLQLAASRWTLLRGFADDTLELAALLGIKYKQEASGQFAHSNLITVLNAQGEIVHQQIGLNQDISATLTAIENAEAARLASLKQSSKIR
ncbi:MAG: SCO family protein [Verrucomicrobia bacterium]|nr:SCO family protein [Verrucomicrobiota bacterium]